MTDSRNDGADADVSARYRELADEHVPAGLDQEVLGAAREALQKNGGWRDTWFRPLTLAATVGLAFAFVLQLNDLSLTVGPPDEFTVPPTLTPDAFQDAGRANEERFQELQVESERSMRSAPRMESPPADTGSAPVSNRDGNIEPATPRCTAAERRSTTTWWNCVRELERLGDRQAAEAELQALLKAFPSFEIP